MLCEVARRDEVPEFSEIPRSTQQMVIKTLVPIKQKCGLVNQGKQSVCVRVGTLFRPVQQRMKQVYIKGGDIERGLKREKRGLKREERAGWGRALCVGEKENSEAVEGEKSVAQQPERG